MSDKKIVIRYDEISAIIVVLVATLYFLISGIIINGAIQIICFCFVIGCSVCFGKNKTITSFDILWILSIIPFFYAVKNWSVADIRDFVAYVAFVVFIVNTKVVPTSINKAIKLLYFMACFHLFFVLLNGMFKTQFYNFLYFILSPKAIFTFERAVNGNYATGLGFIPGDTSGYLVNGIILLAFGNFVLKRKYTIISAIMMLVGVLLCAKKSHLLCIVLAIGLTWILTAKTGKKLKRVAIVLLILVATLTIGYLMMPFFLNIPMFRRISVALDKIMAGSDYTSNRSGLARHAVALFQEKKTWGWGWKYFNKFTAERWGYTNYVNNVYLQLLVETGIVGTVFFCAPMFITFRRTIRKIKLYRDISEKKETFMYLTLSLAFQLFFLTYCFLEIPFYSYPFLMVYGVAIVISNSKLE